MSGITPIRPEDFPAAHIAPFSADEILAWRAALAWTMDGDSVDVQEMRRMLRTVMTRDDEIERLKIEVRAHAHAAHRLEVEYVHQATHLFTETNDRDVYKEAAARNYRDLTLVSAQLDRLLEWITGERG